MATGNHKRKPPPGQLLDRRERARGAALPGFAALAGLLLPGLVLPGQGQSGSTGQVGQAGFRAKQTRRPACGACPVARLCPSFGIGPVDEKEARKLVKAGPFS